MKPTTLHKALACSASLQWVPALAQDSRTKPVAGRWLTAQGWLAGKARLVLTSPGVFGHGWPPTGTTRADANALCFDLRQRPAGGRLRTARRGGEWL